MGKTLQQYLMEKAADAPGAAGMAASGWKGHNNDPELPPAWFSASQGADTSHPDYAKDIRKLPKISVEEPAPLHPWHAAEVKRLHAEGNYGLTSPVSLTSAWAQRSPQLQQAQATVAAMPRQMPQNRLVAYDAIYHRERPDQRKDYGMWKPIGNWLSAPTSWAFGTLNQGMGNLLGDEGAAETGRAMRENALFQFRHPTTDAVATQNAYDYSAIKRRQLADPTAWGPRLDEITQRVFVPSASRSWIPNVGDIAGFRFGASGAPWHALSAAGKAIPTATRVGRVASRVASLHDKAQQLPAFAALRYSGAEDRGSPAYATEINQDAAVGSRQAMQDAVTDAGIELSARAALLRDRINHQLHAMGGQNAAAFMKARPEFGVLSQEYNAPAVTLPEGVPPLTPEELPAAIKRLENHIAITAKQPKSLKPWMLPFVLTPPETVLPQEQYTPRERTPAERYETAHPAQLQREYEDLVDWQRERLGMLSYAQEAQALARAQDTFNSEDQGGGGDFAAPAVDPGLLPGPVQEKPMLKQNAAWFMKCAEDPVPLPGPSSQETRVGVNGPLPAAAGMNAAAAPVDMPAMYDEPKPALSADNLQGLGSAISRGWDAITGGTVAPPTVGKPTVTPPATPVPSNPATPPNAPLPGAPATPAPKAPAAAAEYKPTPQEVIPSREESQGGEGRFTDPKQMGGLTSHILTEDQEAHVESMINTLGPGGVGPESLQQYTMSKTARGIQERMAATGATDPSPIVEQAVTAVKTGKLTPENVQTVLPEFLKQHADAMKSPGWPQQLMTWFGNLNDMQKLGVLLGAGVAVGGLASMLFGDGGMGAFAMTLLGGGVAAYSSGALAGLFGDAGKTETGKLQPGTQGGPPAVAGKPAVDADTAKLQEALDVAERTTDPTTRQWLLNQAWAEAQKAKGFTTGNMMAGAGDLAQQYAPSAVSAWFAPKPGDVKAQQFLRLRKARQQAGLPI